MLNERWQWRIAGLSSGLMLAVCHIWPRLMPMQLIALLPVLYLCAKLKLRNRNLIVAGMYLGLGYTILQMIFLRLPIVMTIILITYITIILTLYIIACGYALRKATISRALAVGALFVIFDWLNFTLLPMWGLAQSFVRPWSAYPMLIGFISFTGITAIAFLIGSIQALVVCAMVNRKQLSGVILTISSVIVFVGVANIIVWHEKPLTNIRVAAIGTLWNPDAYNLEGEQKRTFYESYEELVTQAAQAGAGIVVSPEIMYPYNRHKNGFDSLSDLARNHSIYLVAGYADYNANKNCIVFVGPSGEILGQYEKTHITPFEPFDSGSGEAMIIDLDGISVGGMICQDDNFSDLSRKYGRQKTQIVVVPTYDWERVKSVHLQSSINRTIECGYAVVRATVGGISAIISPKGVILARKDHFNQGTSMIISDVPVHKKQTLFSRVGHWPVPVSVFYLLILIVTNKILIGTRRKKIAYTVNM